MKQPIICFSLIALGAIAFLCTAASGAPIVGWTFETSLSSEGANFASGSTVGPYSAEVGAGSATARHSNSATSWSAIAGNGSAKALSANAWNVGDYFQFEFDATGLNELELSFDQLSSTNGPAYFVLQLSTDGTNFSNFGSQYMLYPQIAWNPLMESTNFRHTVNIGAALANAPTAYFRVVDNSTTSIGFMTPGTVSDIGTSRIDNVFVTSVPEPSSAALGLIGAGIAGMAGARRTSLRQNRCRPTHKREAGSAFALRLRTARD